MKQSSIIVSSRLVKDRSEKEYDLILMDIQLPEMDGIEAMEQIKKNSKKQIPVIALTGFFNERR